MISTTYFENRGKAVLQELQAAGKKPVRNGRTGRAPSSLIDAVLNRWYNSVYVC
ncbi:MAG TPA: hypothetical protein VH475_15450 [Tepidisphaeraceae bacterium]